MIPTEFTITFLIFDEHFEIINCNNLCSVLNANCENQNNLCNGISLILVNNFGIGVLIVILEIPGLFYYLFLRNP